MLPLIPARRDTLLTACDWLLDRKLYAVFDELAVRHQAQVDRFLVLKYRVAESYLKRGKVEEANNIANVALKSEEQKFESHIETAIGLQERSLLDWSVREFEQVIKGTDSTTLHHVRARLLLSEIHHDFERESQAAAMLEPLSKRIRAKDEELIKKIEQAPLSRSATGVIARYHLFMALHHRTQQDVVEELKHLKLGIEVDTGDADLLIAMHRAEGADEAFRKQTQQQIESLLTATRDQINQYREIESIAPTESARSETRTALAYYYNQFAWLAGNVDLHVDEAIKLSHRSLELRPDTAAYLDTLAHCYASKRDYRSAVKYQTQAAKLEPYSHQITSKLVEFKRALAER